MSEGTAPAIKVGAAAGGLLGFGCRLFVGLFLFFILFFLFGLLITDAATGRDYMKGMISRHSSSPCQVGEGRHIRLI